MNIYSFDVYIFFESATDLEKSNPGVKLRNNCGWDITENIVYMYSNTILGAVNEIIFTLTHPGSHQVKSLE